jgi:acetyltransferase-like isoleucine patch superfamily enzyme
MTRPSLQKIPWHLRYRIGSQVATRLRKVTIALTHRHCHVEFQGPIRLGPGFTLEIPDRGTLIVGPGVDFRRDFVCEISGEGRVTIGGGTTFTSRCSIQCTTSVEIGEGCTFGEGTLIVDGSHRFRDPNRPLLEQGYDYRPITIGAGASVMAKSTVLNSIGEGAFIGANSVVTKPIPPFSLAVGAPARVIEQFGGEASAPEDLDAPPGPSRGT